MTEKGELLCRIIAEDEIANAGMTAQWERYLKKIRSQQGTQEAFNEYRAVCAAPH